MEYFWRKSTFSNPSGNCVEVKQSAAGERDVHVRDSKLGDASPVLIVEGDAWHEFIEEVKSGLRFPDWGALRAKWQTGGQVRLMEWQKGREKNPMLEFTAGEWAAFLEGVRAGEFDLR